MFIKWIKLIYKIDNKNNIKNVERRFKKEDFNKRIIKLNQMTV